METTHLTLRPGECWWGGAVDDGTAMPFGPRPFVKNLSEDTSANQANPLLISSHGRFVWSSLPFTFAFEGDTLTLTAHPGTLETGTAGSTLRSAFQEASRRFFPASGSLPDPLLITAPQYNLWIELLYTPTQEKVLAYADAVLAQHMAPGVLMIDDNWQEHYGSWVFNAARFPDPKAMTDRLHSLGFKVMVWISPFVSPDSTTFRMLRDKGLLLKDRTGEVAIRKWWNGFSAVLDCTHPAAVAWLHEEMDRLMEETGVDGFKLDAGDTLYYEASDLSHVPASPQDQCEAWAKVGLRYPLNEYRACWKMAGEALVQRLRDKAHSWGHEGLASLIPNGLAQGLAGYAFSCPDMIGGGEISSFMENSSCLDQELFVRYAQCSALFPMMQFSAAPWRVLDDAHRALCVEAAQLHSRFGAETEALSREAAVTGEPVMRHLAYVFPGEGLEHVTDQFMLGDTLLVAPVLEKGAVTRTVRFPSGRWTADDGSQVTGPCTLTVDAPLSRLPWFRRTR